MELNASQKQAVEYLEGPLLVLAGPGTGKTQLLSSKVAYILKNTDTSPDSILCLTFTDVGVKNMRERLKTMVGRDAHKVNIGTYHTFGSEILLQYQRYSADYDRRLDGAIDPVTQHKIVKKIQDELSGEDILRGDAVNNIISVINEAKAAQLTSADLRRIAEKNIEDSAVISQAISPLLLKAVPRKFRESYEQAYQPIEMVFQSYGKSMPIVKNVERLIEKLARDYQEVIDQARTTEKLTPLSDWRKKNFELSATGEYRLKDRVANKKLLSIAGVMEKYEQYLCENGLFDFNDMIEEAIKALKRDDGFRMTLQEKYQFIMLDEFQDTNPSQFEIVKQLTSYEKPLIMAVGDDDQAIYEFQGALASNLTDFYNHYGAKIISLVDNYRSTQEILDFSREIIKQAPDRFEDEKDGISKKLIAHRSMPEKSQVYRYEFLGSDAEYGFIAEKIAELIKDGVKQNEIAVITQKHKYIEPLLPYLKAHKEISIAYERRDNLLEDEKIHEILTMARFVNELASEQPISVPLLEIFTYPCLKLPTIEMIKIAGEARATKKMILEVMAASDNEKIAEIANWFGELVAKSFNEPLEMFLGRFVEKIEPERMADYERFRFYDNLAALMGQTKRHFHEKPLRLKDLIEMIDDYEAAGMGLNAVSPYRDADDAVRLLTAHGAKGLEFEYVFVVSADHLAWGKGKGNNTTLSLPKNLLQIRHTGITEGEKLRVLYVALTRAKSTLYITNSLRNFNNKALERLEYFAEYQAGDEVISPFLPSKQVTLMYQVEMPKKREENLKNWLAKYTVGTPDMRAIYQERVENFKMSASTLTGFIDIIYGGPERFFQDKILRAPCEPETESLVFGDLVHKTFEAVTKQDLDTAAAINFFLSELEKKDLTPEMMRHMRERGLRDLTIALDSFREILTRGEAEVEFWQEKIEVKGVPITGKIDHIVIDEQNKTIEIYDFKTGKYHMEDWKKQSTLYKYMLQLGFYKLLLNHSRKYANYKVLHGHILFVVTDNDGEVHDKIYDFTEEDEKQLIKLMQMVYDEITSLRFVDDPELMIAPDQNRTLKDMKNFIALLLAKNENIS